MFVLANHTSISVKLYIITKILNKIDKKIKVYDKRKRRIS